MPLNESNVVPRARRLLVCTNDAANFSDKMDIIFVAEMIEKFGKFVEKFKDVSALFVHSSEHKPEISHLTMKHVYILHVSVHVARSMWSLAPVLTPPCLPAGRGDAKHGQ